MSSTDHYPNLRDSQDSPSLGSSAAMLGNSAMGALLHGSLHSQVHMPTPCSSSYFASDTTEPNVVHGPLSNLRDPHGPLSRGLTAEMLGNTTNEREPDGSIHSQVPHTPSPTSLRPTLLPPPGASLALLRQLLPDAHASQSRSCGVHAVASSGDPTWIDPAVGRAWAWQGYIHEHLLQRQELVPSS